MKLKRITLISQGIKKIIYYKKQVTLSSGQKAVIDRRSMYWYI